MAFRGELWTALKKFGTKSGRWVVLAALLGGPGGMTFYVLGVQKIGASFTATISSIFPAVGALFAFLILRDKLSLKNWVGLLISIGFTIALSYSGNLITGSSVSLGLIFVLFCILGWGLEAVIAGYGMKDEEVSPYQALFIRQLTSALTFAIIIIPIFVGHKLTIQVAQTSTFWFIALIAFFGTLSYICYYVAINLIGPIRAMALNISYVAFAILISVFFLGQQFSMKNVIFALCIMAGAVLAVVPDNKKATELEGKVA